MKQQQQRTTKTKTLKTKNKQTTKWSMNAPFASVLEGDPGTPPPLFFILEIPSRTLTAEIGLHLLTAADLLVASGSATDNAVCITVDTTWFALQRATLHFSFSFFSRGRGALSPNQLEESPFPNLNPMYPPNSTPRATTTPLRWVLVAFWTRHWKLASLASTAITPPPPPSFP